jgi:predicted small integral membrane protein
MEWMVWTIPTAIFFLCIFAMLGFMTFIDLRNPAAPRKGFLPMATTRGDRLYITVLGCAFINLAWLGLTDWLQYPALVLCLIWGYVLIRWG